MGRRLAGVVVVVSICAGLAGCGGNGSSAPSVTGTTVSSHAGWKTYTYDKIALDVPSSWLVRYGDACPSGARGGELVLGVDAYECTAPPGYRGPSSYVQVSQLGPETSTTVSAGEKPETISGIPICPGPDSPPLIVWNVPSLDIQISLRGPDSNDVLHTLHLV
jgi:hypothetical protein